MGALLFPGQGSQIVGMGSEFFNNFDKVKKIFNDYIDFDSSENLSEIEEDLNIEIVNNLVEDIFNEAFMNW